METKEEPIRIAQIIGKWLGGGVEAVVMNYYRNIDRTKIQFDFICDEDSTNIPYEEIKKLGGKVILIPPYQKVLKYHRKLKKVLKDGNYKIVHSHINTLSVFSLFAAKCAGVPVRIAHSHSTTNKREKKKNLMKQVLRPFSKVFATNYMCCSELAGRWLFGDKEYDKGNVYLLNNAIDLDKFKYDEKLRKKKRKELGIKDDTLVIGHLGRFVAQKNHTFLIDIFNEIHKKNNNSILLLAGQGPLMEDIKNKVKDLNLDDSVKFLGQRNDANELYQAFDVFLLPSLYEGLPVVGVEAQASGNLTFLSSDMTKETKVLNSTVFIGLDQNPQDWASEILKSYQNYTRNDTKSEISAKGFDITNEAEKLMNYYNMKYPNVLHIINSNHFSGLESVVCDIISNDGYNYNGIYVTKNGPIIEILKEKGIRYEIIKTVSVSELKRVYKKYNPVLIHAHDYTASLFCSIYKKNHPLIIHLHNNPLWLRKINIKSLSFLFSCIKADKIFIVSNSIKEEFLFGKFFLKKIKCVNNPISVKKITSRVDFNDKEKKYDICCVARLTEQKNPNKFLKIISELKISIPNIKAIWIGEGELEQEVKELIGKMRLENNVTLLGFQKNPYQYMKESKVFLLTSDWEGFGLVAFEALSLGLPTVVSNVGGLPTIVDETCGFLCNDLNDYVNELIKLLKDKKYYDIKVTNALIKSKKLDNFQEYIESINDNYREIL